MKKDKPQLAKNIIRFRKAKGWNQHDLAAATGYHVNTIKEIELGKSGGTQSSRASIATALGVSESDLFAQESQSKAISAEHIELVSGIISGLAALNNNQLRAVFDLVSEMSPSASSATRTDIK